MKNTLKRSLSFLLAITLVFGSAYVGLGEVDFSKIDLGGLFAVKTKAANVDNLYFIKKGDGTCYVDRCDESASGAITIPATFNGRPVTAIEMYAFENCKGITSVTIPDSVKKIGSNAFSYCTQLKSVKIGNSVVEIPEYAFYKCTSLKTITLPDNVTKIGSDAFSRCTSLTSITIPNSVTSIGGYTFSGCVSLTSITIPNSVKKIGAQAFSGCINLASVSIGKNVTNIGYEAFRGCASLTSVTIPNSLTEIADLTFYGCTSLARVVIPDNVTHIGNQVFYGCKSLATVYIPNTVKRIGEKVFFDCTSLKSINVGEKNTRYFSIDGVLFDNSHPGTLIQYPAGKINTSYTIPKYTGKIGYWAFWGCTQLKSIVIPDSFLSRICSDAFNGCTSLRCILYSGSKSDWDNMEIHDRNDPIKKAVIHYNAAVNGVKTTTTKATLTNNGIIEEMCSVCGNVSKTTIYSPKTIKFSSSSAIYNGKVRTPSVIVKDSKGKTLVKGTDYKVTVPSGRKLPGVYKYTITFIGEYSGTKTLNFTILPKTPTTISATQTASVINLKWSASTGATGYRIYQYSPSKGKYVHITSVKGKTSYKKGVNLVAGTEYKFKVKPYTKLSNGTVLLGAASDAFVTATECKAPTITSVVSPSKSKATVKWLDVNGETGYQLYYATSKTGTYKKINSYSKNVLTGTKTFSTSASGKTIYFKVRAYKKVNGKVIFGDWSPIKSVKLK